MKTNSIIFSIAITVMIVILILLASCSSVEVYAKNARVVELDRISDSVIVEDSNGELWEFEGCEDWQEGDGAALLMSDNGTPFSIYDDEIISVQYQRFD